MATEVDILLVPKISDSTQLSGKSLTISDDADGTPYRFSGDTINSALNRLADTSGTNTGDQQASDFDIKDLTDSTDLRGTWSGKQDALGFTPENVANKKQTVTNSETDYPSGKAITDELALKAAQTELDQLELEQIQGGVYDVSSHNDGAVFESLSTLLGSANLSTLIPTSVRRGGMSIRFIQDSVPNSDNKYVQYRLTDVQFSTNINYWENLENDIEQLRKEVFGSEEIEVSEIKDGYVDSINGDFTPYQNNSIQTAFYGVEEGQRLLISANTLTDASYFAFYQSNSNTSIDGKHDFEKIGNTEVVVPEGAEIIGILFKFHNVGNINDITLYSKGLLQQAITIEKNRAEGVEQTLQQDIEQLRKEIFGSETREEISADETKAGYVNSIGGIFVPTEGDTYQTAFYGVEEGQRLLISANTENPALYLAFYPSSENSAVDGTTYTYNAHGDTEVVVPSGATRIGIVFKFDGNGSLNNITVYEIITGDCLNNDVLQLEERVNVIADDWSNKVWLLIGDSLTEENIRASVHYYNYISQKTGIQFINKGESGQGYADGDWFYNAIANTNPDTYDLVTIFGSGNDIRFEYIKAHNSMFQNATTWEEALGNIDDNGIDTMCGLFNRAFDKFYQVAPLKKIGIVTPTQWKNGSYDISQLTDEETYNRMNDYSNALVAICRKRGIPCLDLFHTSGLQPTIEAFRVEYYKENGLQDEGIHPNSKGNNWMSNMFYMFLKQYLIM